MGAVTAWVKRWLMWIELAALVVALVLAAWAGYRWRDNTAARDQAEALMVQHKTEADQYKRALALAVANQAAGDKAAADTADAHAEHKKQFQTITRTVIEYAKSHPGDDACNLDSDGLRAWREANAGSVGPGAAEH